MLPEESSGLASAHPGPAVQSWIRQACLHLEHTGNPTGTLAEAGLLEPGYFLGYLCPVEDTDQNNIRVPLLERPSRELRHRRFPSKKG